MSEKKIPVTFRLKKDHIYISYDEKIVEKEKQFKYLFKNRVLGIDLIQTILEFRLLSLIIKINIKLSIKKLLI